MHWEGHIVRQPLSSGMPRLIRQRGVAGPAWEGNLQRQLIEEFPATGESGGTGNRNE
jgi:hypothetical protein